MLEKFDINIESGLVCPYCGGRFEVKNWLITKIGINEHKSECPNCLHDVLVCLEVDFLLSTTGIVPVLTLRGEFSTRKPDSAGAK